MTSKPALCLALLATLCLPAGVLAQRDDLRDGAGRWQTGASWTATASTAGARCLRGDSAGDAFAWQPDWVVRRSWSFRARLAITALLGNGDQVGSAGLALSPSAANPSPAITVTVTRHRSRMTLVEVEYLQGAWHKLLSSGWIPGGDRTYDIEVRREAGDDFVSVSVKGERALKYAAATPAIPVAVLDSLARVGLRCSGARVEAQDASLRSPAASSTYFRSIASLAVGDLLRHFWVGNAVTGHVVDTWNGYPAADLPETRGALWDRGTVLTLLCNLHRVTGDPALVSRIRSDWKRTQGRFKAAEIDTAGAVMNTACDDCGWNALAYLAIHRVTRDASALRHAKALVNSAFSRWLDDRMGGGAWYNDERRIKSLYQVGLILAALEIADLTHDAALRKRAVSCLEWIEGHLLRPDGLYWCDANAAGPVGADRPSDIHEAGSVTFLAGNMGMGVAHARLYRATHDATYLRRAIRTADAVGANLTDGKGVLLDERDAWANGTFACEWALEVLRLPGIAPSQRDLLRATARAIYVRARTPDGCYGGCWNGPADGPGSRWSVVGSRPQQLMTSTNAVNVIVAGALVGRD